jgi:hypothetical protein
MTNKEIEKYKKKLAEINNEVNKETPNEKERAGSIIRGLIKLQELADIVCAKKYFGADLKIIEQSIAKMYFNSSDISYFKDKIVIYDNEYKELSHSIYYSLHTEEMFNACVYAKWSCFWAAIAAIAACISVLLVLFCA